MLDINNPGNIRITPNVVWAGQIGEKDGFVSFDTAFHGLRAMARDLHSYMYVDGCRTIADYIERWSKTDVDAYIKNVCTWCGWVAADGTPATTHYILPGDIPSIMRGITRQENGECPYDDDTIQAAYNDAFSGE